MRGSYSKVGWRFKFRVLLNTRQNFWKDEKIWIHDKLLNTRHKFPETQPSFILYIKKVWSLIMNNEQFFDLTSPPSAEFDTAQELLWYCNDNVKQNGYAVATKNQKIEKYHNQMWFWRKVPRSLKTSNCRKMKTSIIQARQLSIWDIWQKCWWKVEICCQSTKS